MEAHHLHLRLIVAITLPPPGIHLLFCFPVTLTPLVQYSAVDSRLQGQVLVWPVALNTVPY
jgi:hypothetical protein